ncbi:MAG TPA: hypothetical protein VL832_02705 [Puia sp.]|nr:hypothetical protein [Puia sp.]
MKHLIFILLAGYMFLTNLPSASAQKTSDLLLPVRNAGSDAAAVRATSEFWKTFGDSRNEVWYRLPGGFLAEFNEKVVQVRAVYDKKGNWVYSIRQYTEKELPEEVRDQVRSRYYKDTIGVVKELIQPQNTVYLIHIENEARWKTVRVADGEMEVVQDFRKR